MEYLQSPGKYGTKDMIGYFDNFLLKPKPFYHTGLEDTIDAVVLEEKPETERSFPERIFSDKSKTLKATIKQLFDEIILREKLDSFLLYKINEDICGDKTYLEEIKLLTRNSYRNFIPDLTGRRTQIESQILDLEEQKRKEYLECWRDLATLKRYLMSAFADYWNLSKRKEALAYDIAEENLENDASKRY